MARPVAKAKKRKTEIANDAAQLDRHAAKILGEVVKHESRSRHRDDVPTTQIVNVWADEIQAVYEELGGGLDEVNAQDKALTLWREIQTQTNIPVRENEIPYVTCKDHTP